MKLSRHVVRELIKQTIIKNLISTNSKQQMMSKFFVIISDKLVHISKLTDRNKFLDETKKYIIGLFPIYIHFPPDKLEKQHSVMYTGPLQNGISTDFFYFDTNEISDLSFLKPKIQPEFDSVIKSWTMADKFKKDYYEYLIHNFYNYKDYFDKDKDFLYDEYERKAYITIYRELNKFHVFLLSQPLDIPQRFNFAIASFINEYIIGRWFNNIPLDSTLLSNDPRPKRPYHFNMRPGEYKDFFTLKTEIKEFIKLANEKIAIEIDNARWSPLGIEFKKIKKHYEKVKQKYIKN